jgi:hypothetical protein
VFVIIWVFCGVISAIIASNKRRTVFGWFCMGILFGPLAVITVAVLRQLTPNEAARAAGGPRAILPEPEAANVNAVRTKPCPRCAEDVKVAALVCRFCGYDFTSERPSAMPQA